MHQLFGGLLLGWALGANDAANVFGTAVASRMVRYRTAVIAAAGFIVIGALLEGGHGIDTLSKLTEQTTSRAMVATTVAGVTVIGMTVLKLPVSTSQAVVGAILGVGLCLSPEQVRWDGLAKIVICWVFTPIGAAVLAAVLYPTLGALFNRARFNLVTRSIILKAALLLCGCYGAYALGANNVANVTGAYAGTELLASFGDNAGLMLTLIGGLSIASGVLTYSRNVMLTVGSRLVQLGGFSAFVVVLAQSLTVHFYAVIGVPVSMSQAVVGAVVGIGLVKSVRTISRSTLVNILLGWIMTPTIAGGISYAVAALVW